MMRLKRMAFAAVIGGAVGAAMGQMSIEPPTPSATQASTAPAIVAPRVEASSATKCARDAALRPECARRIAQG